MRPTLPPIALAATLASLAVLRGEEAPPPSLNAIEQPIVGYGLKYGHRTISSSGQFVIYCPDQTLRAAITRYVDQIRDHVIQTLRIAGQWRYPIVITMQPPSTTAPNRALSSVQYVETTEGPKIDIAILLKEDRFREVRFAQQVIRALLIETAARHHPPRRNDPVPEPPDWLVEGLTVRFYARNTERVANTSLFRQLIDTGRLPPIADFLEGRTATMDSTSIEIFSECAYSLLEMLTSLPEGRRSLGHLVTNIGKRPENDTAVAQLMRFYPSLGGDEASLEKWWTLGIARFSARMTTLSVDETDEELRKLLVLDIIVHPVHQTTHPFKLEEYATYLRLKSAPLLLRERRNGLALLQGRAHPLMRPVIIEYQRILENLAQRRIKQIDRSLEEVDQYRQIIVGHMTQVTDYMNWYEATQMNRWSGAFDGYLRTAQQLEKNATPKREDALSRYLDQVEREFR